VPKYLVVVERTEVSCTRIEVEAESEDDAWELALEKAEFGDAWFGERYIESFDVNEVEEIRP
jgi:hypothetical protein